MEAGVSEAQVMVSVFSLMVFAGVAVLWMAMSNRRALREMEHRERIALIQSGIVPAPEADPLAFETHLESPGSTLSRKDRWRTAGTLTIGFGMALLVLLSFTGNTDIGFAVGGAFIVLGGSFLLNGTLLSPTPTAGRPMVRRTSTGTPTPPDPPSSAPF
jgi:hypothetical protein